jgi:outer membrane protein TolC
MTAVRRLLIILCVAMTAATLSAQTTKKKGSAATPAQAPPTSTSANPAPADEQPATSSVPTATPPVTADTDSDLNDPRALRLSLSDAVGKTVEQNLGIRIQRYSYQIAAESLVGQYGIFDPTLTGQFNHSSAQNPTVSAISTSSSRSTSANFGIGDTLPTGANVSVGWNNSRVAQVGGFTSVSPAYNSSLGFLATQPLLRNFGIDVTRRGIDTARDNLGIGQETFRGVLINTAVSVEQAYLDLVYTRQFVDVVKEALFLARDQSRITQIRIDVGASAPLDILQPRVQIATQEENLIAAVAAVRDAEDRLRQLMHLDPVDWDRPIIPTDPVRYTPVDINVADSVSRAYQLRPELRSAHYTTEIKKVSYLFARNQMLPQLDLNLSYKASGLGGTVFGTDPTTGRTIIVSDTKYPHALNQVLANDFPAWSVGVTFGVPLFNISSRAQAREAALDLHSSQTIEEQTRESIAIDVRKAARDIDTAAKEITASGAARDAAEKNVDAERKRYENGMTTNFNVLQIQQQLSDARVREINAVVGYSKAVANYHRAVGDTLEVRNINLQEEHPEVPHFFSRFDRYNWLNYASHVHDDPILNGDSKEKPKQEPKQ